jgi:hypothetical protein
MNSMKILPALGFFLMALAGCTGSQSETSAPTTNITQPAPIAPSTGTTAQTGPAGTGAPTE